MKSVIAAICVLGGVEAVPHPDRVVQIGQIQATPGLLWKPALVDRFASQAPGASKSLCGVKGDWKKDLAEKVKSGKIKQFQPTGESTAVEIPASFDSETNWPQCAKVIGDIRDQSNCGCCWAFAGAEAASDRMCISTNASLMVPLSAEDVCFCGSDDGCQGGQIDAPWDYISDRGAVSGGQYQGTGPFGKGMCSDFSLPHCHHHGPVGKDPYPAEGQPGCPSAQSPQCPTKCDAASADPHKDFASDKYTFNGDRVTASGVKTIQQLIMSGGPVETAFTVYSDFENYAGGIYHHTSEESVGGHAVKIVGWGAEAGVNYWKVANSWNPYWGEKGYFRIKFGDSGIDDGVTASPNDAKWTKASGPSPGPSPGPAPGPSPPGCKDKEDFRYCDYTKKTNFCSLLSKDCLQTCGCCVANPPSFCNSESDPTEPEFMAMTAALQAKHAAVVV